MDISTITEKGQTTIPITIRRQMGLRPGDRILFRQLPGGEVALRRITQEDDSWMKMVTSTLHEELSDEADEAAFGNL